MFWWLMTPFVGSNLGEATAELETKLTDKVIERCALLAHQKEMAACARVQQRTIELARTGFFGSTTPDALRIAQLEQEVSHLRSALEAHQTQKP